VFLAIASLAPPNDKSANDNRMCVSRGHGQAAVKKSGLTAIRNTDSGFNCGYVEPMTGESNPRIQLGKSIRELYRCICGSSDVYRAED